MNTPTILLLLLVSPLISAAKLDGVPIHYGSILRIKSSLTGHLYVDTY